MCWGWPSPPLRSTARVGAEFANLEFEPADILNLPGSLDGRFHLVVVADVLYYLSPLDEAVVTSVVRRSPSF